MALTPSNMLPLNTIAPDFTLLDAISNKEFSLAQLKSTHGTVIMFICNHCPFVVHVRSELARLANYYKAKGIVFIAINANDYAHYPVDAPDKMRTFFSDLGNPFPYLIDETQEVARAYDAACTPDIYLFNGDLRLVYRGQLDSSRPGNNTPVTGNDLRSALDNLLAHKPIAVDQKPSIGCNIKWKA